MSKFLPRIAFDGVAAIFGQRPPYSIAKCMANGEILKDQLWRDGTEKQKSLGEPTDLVRVTSPINYLSYRQHYNYPTLVRPYELCRDVNSALERLNMMRHVTTLALATPMILLVGADSPVIEEKAPYFIGLYAVCALYRQVKIHRIKRLVERYDLRYKEYIDQAERRQFPIM